MNREFSNGNREFDLQRHFPPWALLSIPKLTRAPELSRYRGQASAACRRGDQHCEASRGRKHLQQRRRPRSDRYKGGHIRSQGSEALRAKRRQHLQTFWGAGRTPDRRQKHHEAFGQIHRQTVRGLIICFNVQTELKANGKSKKIPAVAS